MLEPCRRRHACAGLVAGRALVPAGVRSLLESGATIHVPPCALHEITIKPRKGKWDEMLPHAGSLDSLCSTLGFRIAPYTARMAMLSGSMEWHHPDPFDRMIAATAIEMACPLVSQARLFWIFPCHLLAACQFGRPGPFGARLKQLN